MKKIRTNKDNDRFWMKIEFLPKIQPQFYFYESKGCCFFIEMSHNTKL